MRTMRVVNYTPENTARVVRMEEVDKEKLLLHWGDDRYIKLVEVHDGRFWHCSDHVSCVLHGGNVAITSLGCHPLYRQTVVVFETEDTVYEPWCYSYLCYDEHGHSIGTRIRISATVGREADSKDIVDVFVSFVDFNKAA